MSKAADDGDKKKDKEDYNLKLVAESTFTTVFPKYRERYMKDAFPMLSSFLQTSHGIKCTMDLLEGSVSVTTTKAMTDPYAIIKSRDCIKLISRGVPFSTAIRVLEEDETNCDIIKIGRLLANKSRFVRRRQRLLGSSGSTLKAIELLTNCYVLIQGNTVAAVGPFKGLQNVRKIVEDCIVSNIHPVFNIKRLMIQKELQNNPQLKDENWERFLPKLPPKEKSKDGNKKKKPKLGKKKKERSLFPPEPTPSKIDLQIESGEYFVNQRNKKKEKEAAENGKQQFRGSNRGHSRGGHSSRGRGGHSHTSRGRGGHGHPSRGRGGRSSTSRGRGH